MNTEKISNTQAVVLMKLMNGDQIICDFLGVKLEDDDVKYIIRDPMVLAPSDDNQSLSLSKYIILDSTNQIELEKNKVLLTVPVDQSIHDLYNQSVQIHNQMIDSIVKKAIKSTSSLLKSQLKQLPEQTIARIKQNQGLFAIPKTTTIH